MCIKNKQKWCINRYCKHLCKYCYANAEPSVVLAQSRRHDPTSPFLIGNYEKDDVINDVQQKSWIIGDLI